jgi:hypothetical protein
MRASQDEIQEAKNWGIHFVNKFVAARREESDNLRQNFSFRLKLLKEAGQV